MGSAAVAVAAARHQALDTGMTVTVHVRANEAVHVVTATPDGRIRGAEALGFDPFGGSRLQLNSLPDASRSAVVRPESRE
jgi:hypothetical protein